MDFGGCSPLPLAMSPFLHNRNSDDSEFCHPGSSSGHLLRSLNRPPPSNSDVVRQSLGNAATKYGVPVVMPLGCGGVTGLGCNKGHGIAAVPDTDGTATPPVPPVKLHKPRSQRKLAVDENSMPQVRCCGGRRGSGGGVSCVLRLSGDCLRLFSPDGHVGRLLWNYAVSLASHRADRNPPAPRLLSLRSALA